jgi:lipid II isoglutaminyl synthase (glutamine-hydrolysing)
VLNLIDFLSLIFGKIMVKAVKLSRSGASAAPGLYINKLNPQLLKHMSAGLKYSLVVSGTNGKTTATRMVAAILKQKSIKYVHNRTGSNLLRGITSALIKQAGLFDSLGQRVGVWEIDEAVLPRALPVIKPKIVVLTNLFRDQLDRYGELDTLLLKWRLALLKLDKNTLVILNSDDPAVASLAKGLKAKVLFFGLRDKKRGQAKPSHASDATLCPYCLYPLNYQTCYFSHIGVYFCRQCGSIQPEPDIKADSVIMADENSFKLRIKEKSETYRLNLKLTGLYNIYNLLAALTAARALKIEKDTIIKGLNHFKPAFGRLETINYQGKILKIMLVKNPAGFNQVIAALTEFYKTKDTSLLLALNDLTADGRDVSWIWDVDFKNLYRLKGLKQVYAAGIRADDLGLRLKYAGFKNIKVEKDLKDGISCLLNQKEKNLFILPTYTAMLSVRKILNQKGLVHSTWKD